MSDRAIVWADVASELAMATPLSSADAADFVYSAQAIGIDDPAEALRLASHAIAEGFDPASYVRLVRDVLATQAKLKAIEQCAGWPVSSWPSRLPRATQRIGCEHPVRLDIRQMDDITDRYLCQSCGAQWMEATEVTRC